MKTDLYLQSVKVIDFDISDLLAYHMLDLFFKTLLSYILEIAIILTEKSTLQRDGNDSISWYDLTCINS